MHTPNVCPQATLDGIAIEDWSIRSESMRIFIALPRIVKVRGHRGGCVRWNRPKAGTGTDAVEGRGGGSSGLW